MSNYRRAFVPGGCWFFTVNQLERRETLLVDHIAALREAVAATRRTHGFEAGAFVVLPDLESLTLCPTRWLALL